MFPMTLKPTFTVLAELGRAGRTGDAILFIAPREKRMLASIERATNKKN